MPIIIDSPYFSKKSFRCITEFLQSLFGLNFYQRILTDFSKQQYCHLNDFFHFFNKSVNKSYFLKIRAGFL